MFTVRRMLQAFAMFSERVIHFLHFFESLFFFRCYRYFDICYRIDLNWVYVQLFELYACIANCHLLRVKLGPVCDPGTAELDSWWVNRKVHAQPFSLRPIFPLGALGLSLFVGQKLNTLCAHVNRFLCNF